MSRRKPGAAADPRAGRARRILADRALGDKVPADRALGDKVPADKAPGLLDGAGGFTKQVEHSNDEGLNRRHAQEYARPRIRWRTGVRAGVLIAVASLVLAGWYWFAAAGGRAQVMPLSAVSDAADTRQASETGDAPTGSPDSGGTEGDAPSPGDQDDSGKIVVHVAGAVHSAGVVELRAGSRIHEAIAAVGGSTAEADLNQLNLAARLEDGQKLLVPRIGEQLPAGDSGRPEGAASAGGIPGGGRINLNTATAEELGALPRVGPVLAQRIIDWRTDHGRFATVEELDAVDGVGPKMLEALLPLVTV